MAIFRWALTRALSDPQSWPFYAIVPANLYQNQFICDNRETNKQTGLKDKGKCVTNSALQSRKWQLIGMSQWCRSALCGHPLPALMDNWTHSAASRHTIAPTSHTWPSPRSRSYYSFPVPLRVEGWVGLSTQWVSNLLKVACSGPGVSRTRNLSVTSPILYHYITAPTVAVARNLITNSWSPLATRMWKTPAHIAQLCRHCRAVPKIADFTHLTPSRGDHWQFMRDLYITEIQRRGAFLLLTVRVYLYLLLHTEFQKAISSSSTRT